MTNEKTESSSEIAERLAKILNNQCPVIADGESYGIEPRRAALIIAPIVRAAIEAAVARAIEDKDAEIANTIPHHQHREIMRALRETSLKAVGHLQAEVERLQADLAAAQQRGREAEREECARHLERGAQFLSFRDEQARYREIAATIRSRGTKPNEPKG